MAMGGSGLSTRLAGEIFGSALTFASGKKSSAPGQIPVNELRTVLKFFIETYDEKLSTDTTFSVMWTLFMRTRSRNHPSCFPRHEILRAYAKLFKENVWNRFLKIGGQIVHSKRTCSKRVYKRAFRAETRAFFFCGNRLANHVLY